MFGGRFSSTTGLVGVDFGTRGVKLLQLREHHGELSVVGAGRVDYGQDAADEKAATALGDHLRMAFTSGGFTGRRCVISVPRAEVCLQSIRLPSMPENELRQAAEWEAAQRFGLDRGAMEVDFLCTGATPQGGEAREEILLVAAPHTALHAALDAVLAAGLRPVAVDTGFSALARIYGRRYRRESDVVHVRAILEVGTSGATVMILRGDQIALCKAIGIGGRDFDMAVAEHLQVDVDAAHELRTARIASALSASSTSTVDAATDRAVYEAVRPLISDLVKEVTLCLRYYGVTFRGHPPQRLILAGGDSLEPKLADLLAHACKIPIGSDEPGDCLNWLAEPIRSTIHRAPGPGVAWSVAAGLSVRGIGSKARTDTEQAPMARRGAA